MVRARDVVRDFVTPEGGTVRAVNGVSFDIAPGEFVAITGQSGCGKTTLLRILLGLMSKSSGELEVSGRPVRGCDHKRAMVFQNAELLPVVPSPNRRVLFRMVSELIHDARAENRAGRACCTL